jgi:UDP:flavonoid glycosyltransferase YjiC (YdhE family)
MRVVIVAIGSAGDVHPFVAIGRGLRERGHEVLIHASAWYEEAVTRAGIGFQAMDTRERYLEMTARSELWDPRKAFPFIMQEAVLAPLRPLYGKLEAEARAGAILVGSSLDLAGRLLQEKHGVRFVTAHVAPAILRTVHRIPVFQGTGFVGRMPRWFKRGFWWLSDKLFDRTWVPQLNAFRRDLGLPDIRRPFDGWWNSPDRVLGLWPDWFGPVQPDWPPQARLTGFPFYDRSDSHPPGADLVRWLDDGPAPVLFTHGSANVQGERFFRESVAVCERLKVRGLLVTANRHDVPEHLPRAVRHESYVPFSLVVPRAAALVSHGGIGTVAQGLRAGVPQLAVPMAHDQHDNGSRLVDLGVGAMVSAERYEAPRGAPLLDALLRDGAMRSRCAERASLLRAEDPIAAACAGILGGS